MVGDEIIVDARIKIGNNEREQFNLNALPFSQHDEDQCEDHVNHMQGVSTTQSNFNMFNLNALPFSQHDEDQCEDHVNHMQGVSTTQSNFNMKKMTFSIPQIDLNANPMCANIEEPDDDTLKKAQAKHQGADGLS